MRADGVPLTAAVAILDRTERRLASEEFDRFFADFVTRHHEGSDTGFQR
jgi:hypothetical protein